MKTCKTCQIIKPYVDFDTSATNKDGRSSWCKQCLHAYYKSRYKPKLPVMQRTADTKQCRICRELLTFDAFTNSKSTYCRQCASLYGRIRNMAKYNLTAAEYHTMSVAQNHVCKICGQADKKRLSIDHDHACCPHAGSCGKCIRGLICHRCNATLGMVEDSVDLLQKMQAYLST